MTTDQTPDNAVPSASLAAFFDATSKVLCEAVAVARTEDAESIEGLARMLQLGGQLTLRCTFAPTSRSAALCVEVTTPEGECMTLMHTKIQRSSPIH